MESIISTFHIDWKIIIAQAVNFGVVFIVLYIFALKPLSKLMAERSEKIAKGVDDAKTNAALLEKTRTEDKKALMLEDAKKEVAGVIENGKKILEAEKVKMVGETKKEIVILAMQATEKLISSKQDLNSLK